MTMLKPHTGMRLTVQDFLALPDTPDRRKMELDQGALYIMAKPRLVHQFFQGKLSQHINNYLDGFAEPPADVFTDVIVALSLERRILLAPDLSIVLRERAELSGSRGALDIVIEILSSDRNRDLIHKRRLYADAGAPEYWIFDPRNDTAALLALANGEYVRRALLTPDDTLATPLLPGMASPLSDVFRHRRRPAEDDG